jgi:hypothetical protein
MNIISRLKLGYYQMSIIHGIHMLRINQKKIHVLIFLNQIMEQWDMGINSFSLNFLNIFFE